MNVKNERGKKRNICYYPSKLDQILVEPTLSPCCLAFGSDRVRTLIQFTQWDRLRVMYTLNLYNMEVIKKNKINKYKMLHEQKMQISRVPK